MLRALNLYGLFPHENPEKVYKKEDKVFWSETFLFSEEISPKITCSESLKIHFFEVLVWQIMRVGGGPVVLVGDLTG